MVSKIYKKCNFLNSDCVVLVSEKLDQKGLLVLEVAEPVYRYSLNSFYFVSEEVFCF